MESISTFFACIISGVMILCSVPCWSEIKKQETTLTESGLTENQPAFQVQAGKLGIVGVHFQSGAETIDEKYMEQLQKIAAVLNSDKLYSARILIRGHSDNKGPADLNLELSRLRAKKVMGLLVDRFGVDGKRLTCDGAGEKSPIATNETESGRFLNRRIEFIYLGETGKKQYENQ
jgi:outer membrane protein OmpA-like peptidoglycan-associated protein